MKNTFWFFLTIFVAFIFMINAVKADSDDDSDVDDATAKKHDIALSQIFDKMSNSKSDQVINLDSTFGGSKCNCVCKEL